MEGYIKLYRQLLSSSIFASQIGLKIWIWCLLKANFKTKFVSIKIGRGESVVEVGRGSFIFGRFVAEDELNIDGSTIYKWIKKLDAEEMIRIKSSSHYSIITICNYDSYQHGGDDEVAAIQQPSNNQVAANQQPSNTTNKEKKEKKDNKENNNIFNFKNQLLNLGVDEKIATDWMLVRKNKKATNTETAFNSLKSQIEKSGLTANECIKIAVERSWSGFNSQWINNIQKNTTQQHTTVTYKRNPDGKGWETVTKSFTAYRIDLEAYGNEKIILIDGN